MVEANLGLVIWYCSADLFFGSVRVVVYGASPQLYGALFGLNALFLVAGAQVNAHLSRRARPGASSGSASSCWSSPESHSS